MTKKLTDEHLNHYTFSSIIEMWVRFVLVVKKKSQQSSSREIAKVRMVLISIANSVREKSVGTVTIRIRRN